jgi:acetylornithine deacetylase/succinyl-diaminopimelate desuccinylase-like protein
MGANLATPGAMVRDLTESRGVREALQWFTREKQWINEMQLQLCRIPSPTFLEGERAQWMAAQLRALGCDAQVDRAGNVVATVEARPDFSSVVVTAHLDTVLAPRARDEVFFDGEGKLRGPGVADNGAGLSALIALAAVIKAVSPLKDSCRELVLAANVGEEGEGNLSGMRHLCRNSPLAHKSPTFLVLDGAGTDHITTQALGSRRFEISFSGPGGHSWSDFGIANPVHAMGRAITLFADSSSAILRGNAPRSTASVSTIDGGSSVNAIATFARAKVDIRSEDNRRIEDIVQVLFNAVERAQETENSRSSGAKVAAKLKELGSRPAAKLPEDAAILNYVRAVDAHLGIRSRIECSSTDANIPLSLEMPALSIGAGGLGGGAHTPDEWFNPDGRDLGLKRVFLTLALLLRDESGLREDC